MVNSLLDKDHSICPQKTQAFTDVITDGVRLGSRWWGGFDLLRRLMFITVITFMDSIQPDFSQVYIASLALLSRVPSLTLSYTHPLSISLPPLSLPPSLPFSLSPPLPPSLPPSPSPVQLSLCLVAMVVLGVLCFSKPYTNHYINIIEAIILVDLLTISFIFLNAKEAARVPPPVFHILLLLPYIYAVVNITWKIAVPLW